MGGDRQTQNTSYGWGQKKKKIHLMDGDRLTQNTSNGWGQTKTENLGFRIKKK